MKLSQEAIQRMISGRSGGGGGGGSFDPSALAGYATQAWTEENYISKTFFNELFIVHKKVTTVVMDGETEISRTVTTNSVFAPNEIPGTTTETDEETGYVTTVTTEIASIESKKGFWTNYFISALGLNSEGGGGGLTLNEPLATINVSGLANHPSSSGQTIVWNGSAWVYGTAGGGTGTVTGVKVGDVTYSPVNGIVSIPAYPTSMAWSAITGKPNTLAGYGITDAKIENGVITLGSNTITPLTSSDITDMATKTWVWAALAANGSEQINASHLSTALGGYLPLSGGTMTGDITMSNNVFLRWKDSGGTSRMVLGLTSDSPNILTLGSQTAAAGYKTYIYGSDIYLRYGTSLSVGMVLDSTGDVGIGTMSPYAKLDVNGSVKVTKLYLYKPNQSNDTNAVYLEYNSGNGGIHLVGGGLYADTYVSALGLSDSGSSAFDETAMWQALGTTISAKNIALAYIQSAADTRYALRTDVPTMQTLSWSYGSVTSASSDSYNGGTSKSFVIPSSTSHLTNGAGFITSSALSGYALTSQIPTNNNQLANGAGYITSAALSGYLTQNAADQLYLLLSGGTMTGDITMSNNVFLRWKDSGGTSRMVLGLTSDNPNILTLGSQTAQAGYKTYIYGSEVYLRYGTAQSAAVGMVLNASGTIGIGTSTPNTNYKLDVAGFAKAGRLYLSDDIYMVVENNGIHIVGGGLYADTYVSALGLSDSQSGVGIDWEALGAPTNEQINISHLTTALANYLTQSSGDLRYARLAMPNNLVHNSNEITMVPSAFHNVLWLNYRTEGGTNGNITRYNIGNGATGYSDVAANGFIKNSSSDSYVLLGGGGHKLESSLSVGNADTLDGHHASDFVTSTTLSGYLPLTGGTMTGNITMGTNSLVFDINASSTWNVAAYSGLTVLNSASSIPTGARDYYSSCLSVSGRYGFQLASRGGDNNRLSFRNTGHSSPTWHDVAFTDSNVASATQLATSRTLWGRPFNGMDNVSGSMTGVGDIAMTGKIDLSGGSIINTNNGYIELGSGGNEMVISGGQGLHVNYRGSANGKDVPTNWYWHSGSSSTYTNFTLGGLFATTLGVGDGRVTWESNQSYQAFNFNSSLFVYTATGSDRWLRARNASGIVDLLASTNRGLYDASTGRWIAGTNSSGTYTLIGGGNNVGIGFAAFSASDTPQYKLDVKGTINCSSIRIGGITLTADNGGIHVNSAGLYADTYVSALGVSSGGGSGTVLNEPLSSINGAGLGTPTQSGVAIVWNGSRWIYGATSSSGSVTDVSLTTPDGFTVDKTTSSGNVSLAVSFGGSIAANRVLASPNGSSGAPSWRALVAADIPNLAAGKITSGTFAAARIPDLSGTYATSNRVTTLEGYFSSGSAKTAVKLNTSRMINGTGFDGSEDITTSTWGTSRNISIANSDGTGAGSPISVDGAAAVTLRLPSTIKAALTGNASSATKLATSRKLWGRNFDGSADVSGNIEGAGTIYASGHLIMHNGGTGIYLNNAGTGIDWHNASNEYVCNMLAFGYDDSNQRYLITVSQDLYMPESRSIQIGGGKITWDAQNNAFRIQSANGGAANLYALGGISALGMSGNTMGEMDGSLIPSVNGGYDLGSIYKGWTVLYLANDLGQRAEMYIDDNGDMVYDLYGGSNQTHCFEGKISVSGTSYLSGKVSIGGTNSNGTRLYVSASSATELCAYFYGNASANTFTSRSDMRLKDFVENINLSVESIAAAPCFKYTFKGDSRLMAGTSAQYWRGVLSEVVFEDADTMLSLDYGVTALAGVISVARKVMTHEERIAALEAENERLRNEIETLKAA